MDQNTYCLNANSSTIAGAMAEYMKYPKKSIMHKVTLNLYSMYLHP